MARVNPTTGKVVCSSYHCNKKVRLHFDPTDGGYYCTKHTTAPETREQSADARRRLFNSKKQRMCDAFACTSKVLESHRGGLFCAFHRTRIEELRQHIEPHLGTSNEIYARIVEVHFRKRCDGPHWDYVVAWVLEQRDTLAHLLVNMRSNPVFQRFPEYYEVACVTLLMLAQG